MRNRPFTIFSILVLAAIFVHSRCNKTGVYSGPLLVEFQQAVREVENGYGIDHLEVQLIGEQQNKDLTVRFIMIDSTTTANHGVDFELLTIGEFKIDAHQSIGYIAVDIPKAQRQNDVQVTFQLEESGDVVPNHNYKTLTYIIKK